VPRPEAYKGGGAAMAQASRGALDALFASRSGADQAGGGQTAEPAPPSLLDDLFKK